MPRNGQFGSKELCKLLSDLGFKKKKSVGSSHEKWSVPKDCKVKAGQRSFIIVVKNKKAYMLPTCNGYLKQIREFGYSVDSLCS